MTGRMTDWQIEQWLESIREDIWVALHFDNPDVAGQYNSEVFGGGYHRQKASMTMPNNRAIWNSSAVVFNGLPTISITHVCAWDSQINGNLRFSVALDDPVRVVAGGQYSFGTATMALSLD